MCSAINNNVGEWQKHAPILQLAFSGGKWIGREPYQKNTNTPAIRRTNCGSLKGRAKTPLSKFEGLGGSRDLTVKRAKLNIARIRKAQILMVQPNPTSGIK